MASVGEKNKEERDTKEDKLKASIDAVLRTEPGRALFKYLFEICGYNKTSLVMNPRTGEILNNSTAYNEARRGVYIMLRQRATYELLKVAEEAAELAQRESTVEKVNKKENK